MCLRLNRRRIEILNSSVFPELDALAADLRVKYDQTVGLIEKLGIKRIPEPYVKRLRDKLGEMYEKSGSGLELPSMCIRRGFGLSSRMRSESRPANLLVGLRAATRVSKSSCRTVWSTRRRKCLETGGHCSVLHRRQ